MHRCGRKSTNRGRALRGEGAAESSLKHVWELCWGLGVPGTGNSMCVDPIRGWTVRSVWMLTSLTRRGDDSVLG